MLTFSYLLDAKYLPARVNTLPRQLFPLLTGSPEAVAKFRVYVADLSPEPVVFGSSPLCSLRGFAKTAAAVFSTGKARGRAHGEAERAGRTA